MTKYYGVKLIDSETTAAGLDGMVLRCLDRVKVKGKTEPVTIYEPVGSASHISSGQAGEIRDSNQALEYYFAGDLERATAAFQALRDAVPEHRLYELYLERIAALQSQGIGDDWDGVFEHTSK